MHNPKKGISKNLGNSKKIVSKTPVDTINNRIKGSQNSNNGQVQRG